MDLKICIKHESRPIDWTQGQIHPPPHVTALLGPAAWPGSLIAGGPAALILTISQPGLSIPRSAKALHVSHDCINL